MLRPASRALASSAPLVTAALICLLAASPTLSQVNSPEWVADAATDLVESRATTVVALDNGDVFFVETRKPAGQDALISELVGLDGDGAEFARARILAHATVSVEAFALEEGGGDTLIVGVTEHVTGFILGRLHLQSFVRERRRLRALSAVPLDALCPGADGGLEGRALLVRPGTGTVVVMGQRPGDATDIFSRVDFVALLDAGGAVVRETTVEPRNFYTRRGFYDLTELGDHVYALNFGTRILTRLALADGAAEPVTLPLDGGAYEGIGLLDVHADTLFFATQSPPDRDGARQTSAYAVDGTSARRIGTIPEVAAEAFSLDVDAEAVTFYAGGSQGHFAHRLDRRSGRATVEVAGESESFTQAASGRFDNFAFATNGDLLLAGYESSHRDDVYTQGTLVTGLTFGRRFGNRLYGATAPSRQITGRPEALGTGPGGGPRVFIGGVNPRVEDYTRDGALLRTTPVNLPDDYRWLRAAAFAPDGRLYVLAFASPEGFTLYAFSAAGALTATYPVPSTYAVDLFGNSLFPKDGGDLTAVLNLFDNPPESRQLVLRFAEGLHIRDSLTFASTMSSLLRQTSELGDGGVVQVGSYPTDDGGEAYQVVRVDAAGDFVWRFQPRADGATVWWVDLDVASSGGRTVVVYQDYVDDGAGTVRVVLDGDGEVISRLVIDDAGFEVFSDYADLLPGGTIQINAQEASFLARIDTVMGALEPALRIPTKSHVDGVRYVERDGRGFLSGVYPSGFSTAPLVAGYASVITPVRETASAKTHHARAWPNPAPTGATVQLSVEDADPDAVILDASGRTVARVTIGGAGGVVLPVLPKGHYVLRGTAADAPFVAPVIVQ